MKVKTLIICILAVLVVSNVSLTLATEAPEQKPQEPVIQEYDSSPRVQQESVFVAQAATAPTQPARPARRLNITPQPVIQTPESSAPIQKSPKMVTRVFELRYVPVLDVQNMLSDVFSIRKVYPDLRSNKLIVQAMEGQMGEVQSLIAEMDVEALEASAQADVQNLVYRIYMFETFSVNEAMKSFSMILRTTTHVSSQELLHTAGDKDLQISEFLQSNDFNEPQVEIQIQGKAASNESLERMVSGLAPESHIIELKWDEDEIFTNNIPSAQYTQLSEQMQKHIRKFLGDDIRTVGYWFGDLSTPGEVRAPIGPWTMMLRLDTESDRMLEFDVKVEIPDEINPFFHTQLGQKQNNEILSNTIRAKIGKPIIIGYNRESYGTRKMGAMVIIPEVDMIQSEDIKSNF